MLSINTNLSSLIAQSSLKDSTNILNQAIERMTTGYKINHASDNAANYSIATNMATQIGSYNVAADNVAMGMDLVTTASDTISLMQNKAERLRALCTQARNGTYGAQSLSAMNAEANAIMSEINRIYVNAEYNGIKLFDLANGAIATQASEPVMMYAMRSSEPVMPEAKAEYGGFISDPKTYEDSYVNSLTSVSSATLTSGGKYKIANTADLQKLADFVNAGNDTTNMTFILANDIDLSSVENWESIGGDTGVHLNPGYYFKGTFDGNGHIIENINNTRIYSENLSGLFFGVGTSGIVKNVGLKNINIHSDSGVAGLSMNNSGTIKNCYTTGSISNLYMQAGGLVADNGGTIEDCYSTVIIEAQFDVGGLVGTNSGTITNSFVAGDVCPEFTGGGFVGSNYGTITNCYANNNVINPYTDIGTVGGFAGLNEGEIVNCNSLGEVSGNERIGGIAGDNSGDIIDCEATGTVTGNKYVGGLVGYNTGNITNSTTSSSVSGDSYVGGLVGQVYKTSGTLSIMNSTSNATVNGANSTSTGNFIGGVVNTSNGTSFGTIDIQDCTMVPESATAIGGCFNTSDVATGYDMTTMLAGINPVNTPAPSPGGGTGGGGAQPAGAITLQIGLNGNSSSSIGFDVSFTYDLSLVGVDLASDEALNTVDDFINMLSEQETKLGAVQNRLESALESISVNIENLTSSLSTIRDADIAEVSAQYIQQQILQQASATLMSTANQSPSIALQLI